MSPSGDVPRWATGAGVFNTDQTRPAAEFFRTVTGWDLASGKPSPASAVLAGHSLGGGLAGFVVGIYDANAALFDNVPFGRAAENPRRFGDAQVGSADPASAQERHAARAFFNGAAPL